VHDFAVTDYQRLTGDGKCCVEHLGLIGAVKGMTITVCSSEQKYATDKSPLLPICAGSVHHW
jgi:hypothetical protein